MTEQRLSARAQHELQEAERAKAEAMAKAAALQATQSVSSGILQVGFFAFIGLGLLALFG